jgi:hypothetical protein
MAISFQAYAFDGVLYPAPLLSAITTPVSTTLSAGAAITLFFDALPLTLANFLLGFVASSPTMMNVQLMNGRWIGNIPILLYATGTTTTPIITRITVTRNTLLITPEYLTLFY